MVMVAAMGVRYVEPRCGYCNGEQAADHYELIQLRARADRKHPTGGWQEAIAVGPQCMKYIQESMPGDWRYFPPRKEP